MWPVCAKFDNWCDHWSHYWHWGRTIGFVICLKFILEDIFFECLQLFWTFSLSFYPDNFLFSNECGDTKECVVPGVRELCFPFVNDVTQKPEKLVELKVYALVGACAFLGGVTRMTGNHNHF
jgi:hypothetical protein